MCIRDREVDIQRKQPVGINIFYNVIISITEPDFELRYDETFPTEVTGRCGLEGLVKAHKAILEFYEVTIEEAKRMRQNGYRSFLIIDGMCQRRKDAFRWMRRDGFIYNEARTLLYKEFK